MSSKRVNCELLSLPSKTRHLSALQSGVKKPEVETLTSDVWHHMKVKARKIALCILTAVYVIEMNCLSYSVGATSVFYAPASINSFFNALSLQGH